MPFTEQDEEKYEHLRSRFTKMANRLLGEDGSHSKGGPGGKHGGGPQRKTRRAAAHGIMNPEEIKRRKHQMASVEQMKTQMKETVEERDRRIGELQQSEMKLRQDERLCQAATAEQLSVKREHSQNEKSDKLESYKKARKLDAEQRKHDKEFHVLKSREQHEQEEARRQKTQQKVERRILHNREIKNQSKSDYHLRYQQSRLQRELEMRERDMVRQARDHEDRRRRAEAEQMRIKRELQETALALAMEEKKRQRVEEEEARQEMKTTLSLMRSGRSRDQQLTDQAMIYHEGTQRNEEETRRVLKTHRNQQEQHLKKRQKDERSLAELDLKRRQASDFRHHLGDAINHVERDTIGKLSSDFATLADNKAALLRAEERFGTWCETKTEELRFTKSVAQQVVESKRRLYLQSTKETSRDLKKTTSRYQDAVTNLYKVDKQVHDKQKMISTLSEELAALRRANDRKMKEAAIKIRQEEEKLQQQLLREHAELTAELGHRASVQDEVKSLSHRMTEDTVSLTLQEKELKKYDEIDGFHG